MYSYGRADGQSKKSLKEAEDDIDKEFYDLCMFLEQTLQLLLKYTLAKEVERAYINARYLPFKCEKEAEEILKFVKSFRVL